MYFKSNTFNIVKKLLFPSNKKTKNYIIELVFFFLEGVSVATIKTRCTKIRVFM